MKNHKNVFDVTYVLITMWISLSIVASIAICATKNPLCLLILSLGFTMNVIIMVNRDDVDNTEIENEDYSYSKRYYR